MKKGLSVNTVLCTFTLEVINWKKNCGSYSENAVFLLTQKQGLL